MVKAKTENTKTTRRTCTADGHAHGAGNGEQESIFADFMASSPPPKEGFQFSRADHQEFAQEMRLACTDEPSNLIGPWAEHFGRVKGLKAMRRELEGKRMGEGLQPEESKKLESLRMVEGLSSLINAVRAARLGKPVYPSLFANITGGISFPTQKDKENNKQFFMAELDRCLDRYGLDSQDHAKAKVSYRPWPSKR